MRKRTKIGLLIFALVTLAAVLTLVGILRHGFSARDEPTALEAFVARRLRQLAVPSAARNMENPVAPTGEALSEARAHFADHCAL